VGLPLSLIVVEAQVESAVTQAKGRLLMTFGFCGGDRLYAPMSDLSGVHIQLSTCAVSFEKIFRYLDLSTDDHLVQQPPLPSGLSLAALTFSSPKIDTNQA